MAQRPDSGVVAEQIARFAAEQPELTAAAVFIGYAGDPRRGRTVLEIASAAAELLSRRTGGRLARVVDLEPWQGATVDDLGRVAPELVAVLAAERTAESKDRSVGAATLAAAAPILLALEHAAASAPRPPARWLGRRIGRSIVRARRWLHPDRDDATALPRRIGPRVWLLTFFAFVSVYTFMWSVVHVVADSRPCIGHLDDPLHSLIPFDPGWWLVTNDLYVAVTLATTAAMFAVAALGDHRPIVRWGMALAIVGALRSATIWLVPLCRVGVEAGTARLAEIPWLELGPLAFMWRPFASNDLLFSGHVAECILALLATRSWPRPIRAAMWLFLVVQAYALLAARGHYAVDILVAVPMAYLADRASVRLVGRLSRPTFSGRARRRRRPAPRLRSFWVGPGRTT